MILRDICCYQPKATTKIKNCIVASTATKKLNWNVKCTKLMQKEWEIDLKKDKD